MEQRRNRRAGEAGDPRENLTSSDIVRHDSYMRKYGGGPDVESNPVLLEAGSRSSRSLISDKPRCAISPPALCSFYFPLEFEIEMGSQVGAHTSREPSPRARHKVVLATGVPPRLHGAAVVRWLDYSPPTCRRTKFDSRRGIVPGDAACSVGLFLEISPPPALAFRTAAKKVSTGNIMLSEPAQEDSGHLHAFLMAGTNLPLRLQSVNKLGHGFEIRGFQQAAPQAVANVRVFSWRQFNHDVQFAHAPNHMTYDWLHRRGSKLYPRIGSKIDTANYCTIRVQSWSGDRYEVHFEPPKSANHEISLMQHFHIGTKIKLDPGSGLGSFYLGSGKMLVQPGIRDPGCSYTETSDRNGRSRSRGAAVVWRLDYSPQTATNRVRFPDGPPPPPPTMDISRLGIVPDDAAGRRVFSGTSRFPLHPCIPTLIHTRLASPP
ncbi:hypothetical protein PR048_032654 [Dryococelus australis]|uniref:Uncharacterized protein n=1 Tax=Dryococelus australis TaxID=614101 RepID=A0ABQ9G3K9_9NEOP|nr:hypothetical protein PR048_032654 [Dryococelus australis]